MEFRILGPVEVWDGSQRLVPGGPRPRTLLAVLLVHANQVVSTDRLIDQLWGEAPPATARNLIQIYVSQLRRTLHRRRDGSAPGQVLLTRPPGYLLRVEAGELDLHRFEELGAQARRATADGHLEGAAQRWRAALTLWRGPPLDGVASEALQRGAVPRLEEARLVALEERLEVDLRLGRHAELVGELETLVTEHPLRERLRRQLMLALYRSGRPAEALAVYHRTRQVLVEELGLEPSPAMQELERAILLADPALEPTLETAIEALGQPVSPLWPYQLPPDIDDFTGREAAAAEVQQLLEAAQATAVVISAIAGKAGVGKTALAVHVAHRLRSSYPDGQLYVNLQGAEAQARDPTEVLAGFLRALGVPGAAIAESLEERVRQYRSRLADRRVLVVLDDAASEAQVRPLLPGSGGCGALVTSRASLSGLEAAHPLTLEVLAPDQAVALLGKLTGPGRVAAEPEAALAIVRLCGWLPLAVRIAGARLAGRPHWRVALLAERLGDEHRRLDELRAGDLEVRASVALSYQGRGEQERRLFRLLGLLAAPSFPAWVAACLLNTALAEAEGLLERLVDAQLVEAAGEDQAGQLRYRLHDLLRVYARERLEDEEPVPGRLASLERVLRASMHLAEHADSLLVPSGLDSFGCDPGARRRPEHPALLTTERDPAGWFEAERASLVAAVRQACEADQWELSWRIATALGGFFQLRGYWSDWRRTNVLALGAARRADDRDGQARVLASLGTLYDDRNRLEYSVRCYKESMRAFRETGNRRGELQSLVLLAQVELRRGSPQGTVGWLERSLAELEELRLPGWEAIALFYLGEVHHQQGRPEAALDCLERSLALFRTVNDGGWEAAVLRKLGEAHARQGRIQTAIHNLEQSLALVRAIGDRLGEAYVLLSAGEVHRRQGHLTAAASCLERSLELARSTGDRNAEAQVLLILGDVRQEQGRLDEAFGYLESCRATFHDLRYPAMEARALNSLGNLRAAKGDQRAARSAWRPALAIFRELGMLEAAEVAARLNRRRP